MGYFTAYFDESGKHQKSRVVSFCGFLNPDWDTFNDEWRYLLRKNKIPALHMSKADLKSTGTAIAFLRPFVQVIKKHVEHGFGIVVDAKAFLAMDSRIQKNLYGDPHFLAFRTVMRDVVRYASATPDPSVSVVCDDDAQKACDCYRMFDRLRQDNQYPENRRVLKSMAFADDNFYPALQAADLFSWVARAEGFYRFHGERYSLRELFSEFNTACAEYKIEYTTGLWGEAHLLELNTGTLAGYEAETKKQTKKRIH